MKSDREGEQSSRANGFDRRRDLVEITTPQSRKSLYTLVPQGAQELANGLFTGNPYWPGGATQQSVSIAEPSGPEIGPPAVEPLENYP